MNAITRWDPFKEMEELQNRLSNLLGRTPARLGDAKEESITVSEWGPLVDIKEDVKVGVENGLLTIVGERKFEKEENKKYHRVERAYGRFVRSFVLPDGADAEKVNAEFKDGVLKVHLPKSEKTKPKQIEVKVA